jgi:uncharacterized repeat protein (TIGR03803 family)
MQKAVAVFCALVLAGCAGSERYAPPANAALPAAGAFQRRNATFKHLFSFDGKDGRAPFASLVTANGALVSTTYGGGSSESGTAYRIDTSGTESVLHNFKGGKDGSLPEAPLLDVSGTLYGTTANGGGPGQEGVVFSIGASGGERILHRFGGSGDGANPYAGLTLVNGMLYGTTAAGGAHSGGTVFAVTPSGNESVVYSFGSATGDGTTPVARLLDVKGTLFGTTSYGGGNCGSYGCGTVFKIALSGAESVLHSFKGGKDGALPLEPLIDAGGTLYGTTSLGGAKNAGTVYTITPSGGERIVYSFKGGADGANPQSLTALNGTLYGTTAAGGTKNDGTIFSLTPSGTKTVLYEFAGGTNGAAPRAGLHVLNGTLYGTTAQGGASKAGTVFSIRP